jgi:hypothetical protein
VPLTCEGVVSAEEVGPEPTGTCIRKLFKTFACCRPGGLQ